MESIQSWSRALRGPVSSPGFAAFLEPQRVLGVVDGLVSVTQRAWSLLPITHGSGRMQ